MKISGLPFPLTAMLAGGLMASAAPALAADPVSFKNETFKVMVGFPPGGG